MRHFVATSAWARSALVRWIAGLRQRALLERAVAEEMRVEALAAKGAGGARVVMFSNPTKTTGYFYDAFHKNSRFWKCIQISSEESPNVIAGEKLVPQILRARTRVRRRFLVRISVLLGVAGGLTMLGARLANQINRIDAGRRLDRLVADLHVATEVWSGEEVKARLRPVRDDPDLPGLMQRLADDPALPSPVRVNAWQALVALRDGRQTEWRTYIERIDWKGGQVADVLWANTTFGRGNISGLVAERVRMAGLVFGPGPNAREVGLTLADVHILDADIWFLRIDGTQLLDVVFENCKFRGAQLDLSAAAAVQFVSREKHAVILSTDVAIVEDSWIVYRGEPPEQGVMDLAEPEQELLFDGVQFARVQFEGHLKPAWFRNCHFIDCVFPADLKAADLDPHGNTIEGAWLSRS